MAEQITELNLDKAMSPRFMSYAQSVLMDRAIPSGFDGLKPIHRRILVAMNRIGLASNQPYKKSAKTIGVCIGELSPHGDASAYEAMVGLAQDFNMRYPLVDGSGNFASVNDPSSFAAMRYTEARLSPFGELLIGDVDNLADMKDNFDNSSKEPINLVGYFPELLCNPCNGIAVGFATKFAPHYARDVYNAIIKVIDNTIENKDTSIDELIDIIKAPDFPTGAQIINTSEIRNIYKTGHGSVILRAKYEIKKDKIIYTEIPYKVSPNAIVMAIASLNIPDIKDVRDESSYRTGIRIVVDLKKGANSDWIINKLFKETPLQSNYNINMVAIMDNKPIVDLNLKTIINYFLNNIAIVHNKDLRKQYDEVTKKLASVNTMIKVIQNLEDVIQIIKTDDDPKKSLVENLGFTENEVTYILNCKLSSLSKASKEDLDNKKVKYEAEQKRILDIVKTSSSFLIDLKNKFISIRDSKIFKDDCRRTELLDIQIDSKLDPRSYIKNEPVIITYSNKGMIKATKPEEFKTNRRNAMGVKSKTLRENEFITHMLTLDTHSELLLFSDLGKCYTLPVYKIPINGRNAASKSINNYLILDDNERILSIIGVSSEDTSDNEDKSVVMVTKKGFIKRIDLALLSKARNSTSGTKAITLQDDDKIKGVNICAPNTEIVIFTSQGRGLKLNIDDEAKPIRKMGKTARGCSAIKLKNEEVVVNASVIDEDRSIVLITSNGFGKRLDSKAFKNQKRNQTPINYMAKIDKVGKIIDGIMINKDEDLLITTKQGQTLRVNVDDINSTSRTAQGVKMINIKDESDSVVGISAVKREETVEDGQES